MNARELRRGEVLSRVKRGKLKLTEGAELLEISYRQARRLKKRYGEGRVAGSGAWQRRPGFESSRSPAT